MGGTPFDDLEQKESKSLVTKSEKKAKEDQGYLMSGKQYQNKMINIVLLMKNDPMLQGIFRYNDFTGCIEYAEIPSWDASIKKGKRIDDGDEVHLKNWLAEKYHFEPSTSLIGEALYVYAKNQRYHPIKNYLEALKWDKKKRLNTWLHKITGVEKNAYTSLVGRKMICAMVKRIYHPGCQFDNLIVLEGKEGIYKTTMLRILGGKWYAPFSIKAESKDAVDVMMGKWLLEMEELATMRGSEIEYVDAFLSRNVDRVRLSYRRNAQDFHRQCIFVGTMNPIGSNQYLKKQSQNRRFWPVECQGTIKIEELKEIKDQLFAEAMQVFEEENLFMDNEEAVSISLNKQEERKAHDFWVDIIDEYLTGKTVVRATDVLAEALTLSKDKINHTSSIRLGICMRQLGWIPRAYGSKKQRYYQRPDADLDTINESLDNIDWNEDGKQEDQGELPL